MVLPDPVSPFAGSRYTQRNEIRLGEGASLLLLDAYTCGRAAHGERWELARYAGSTRVHRGDRLLLRDAVLLDAGQGDLLQRMGRFEALATVGLVGPRFSSLARRVLGDASAAPLTRRADVLVSANSLPMVGELGEGEGAVVRLAAISVERLTTAVRRLLRNLPEILGDDPFARKW